MTESELELMAGLLSRLDAHDRNLLLRWSLDEEASRITRYCWIGVTHLGSAVVTVGSVLVPLLLAPWPRTLSWRAAPALAISHLIIQLIKRWVSRERPSERHPDRAAIADPDRFSFPSGHATSSFAVALSYAVAFPALIAPLVVLGFLVGLSRVVLGVHYPGDVFVGQLIAALTVLLINS